MHYCGPSWSPSGRGLMRSCRRFYPSVQSSAVSLYSAHCPRRRSTRFKKHASASPKESKT
jgi:hypothetical protein